MIRRLRIKFVCINMAIVTVMLCMIFVTVLYFTKANLEEESIGMMRSIAMDPLQLIHPGDQGEGVRLPYFAIQMGPSGEAITVGGGYYDLSDREFLLQLVAQSEACGRETGVLADYGLRFYRLSTPNARCIVFADVSSERSTMEHLLFYCLLIGSGSFLLFFAISLFLAQWAVKPVDLAWQQQRQFVADASHELKTPLTVITTSAELLQDPSYGEGKRRDFLDSILTMSRQMRRLIEQMLELARVDGQGGTASFARVDFSDLVSRAVLPFEAVFFERGMPLHTEMEEGILISGRGEELQQVVEILLDNAQKYAREGGATWVTLRRQGKGRCLLQVADQGEEIPPEALRSLFKRFYRADPARSRDGSFGLGLSIAESIVQQHRGKIWAESGGGLNTFSVELPCER